MQAKVRFRVLKQIKDGFFLVLPEGAYDVAFYSGNGIKEGEEIEKQVKVRFNVKRNKFYLYEYEDLGG